jgi:hypothetical protein
MPSHMIGLKGTQGWLLDIRTSSCCMRARMMRLRSGLRGSSVHGRGYTLCVYKSTYCDTCGFVSQCTWYAIQLRSQRASGHFTRSRILFSHRRRKFLNIQKFVKIRSKWCSISHNLHPPLPSLTSTLLLLACTLLPYLLKCLFPHSFSHSTLQPSLWIFYDCAKYTLNTQ